MRRLAFHVLEAEVITLLIARISLELSLGSAVRHMEDLRCFEVIRPSTKLLRPAEARGGRRVIVYVVPEADVKRVKAVCSMHRKLENPLYLCILEIAEGLLLKTGSDKDTSYRAVVQAVKASGNVSKVPSVAECVVRILAENGIRVWR